MTVVLIIAYIAVGIWTAFRIARGILNESNDPSFDELPAAFFGIVSGLAWPLVAIGVLFLHFVKAGMR